MGMPWEAGALAPLALVEVKVAVLLLLAGGTALALRRASAAARHLAWTVGVAAALALPPLAALPGVGVPVAGLPGLRLAVGSEPAGEVVAAAPGVEAAPTAAPVAEVEQASAAVPVEAARVKVSAAGVEPAPTAASRAGVDGLGAVTSRAAAEDLGAATPRLETAPPRDPARATSPVGLQDVSWLSVAVGVWAAGALLLLGLLALSGVRVRRMAAAAAAFPEGPVTRRCADLARRVGLRRPPVLLTGAAGSMPLTWGLRRPVLMLPSDAAGWPRARLDAVLIHELAHVRRRDVAAQWLAEVTCALHWPNPLAWLAVWRLRVERERACDDRVLAAGARPSAYAADLLEMARSLRPARATSLAALAMARRSELTGRLLALLDEGRPRDGVSRRRVFGAGSLGLIVALPLSLLVPGQPAAPAGGGVSAPEGARVTAYLPRGGVLLAPRTPAETAPAPRGTPPVAPLASAQPWTDLPPAAALASARPQIAPRQVAPPCPEGAETNSLTHNTNDDERRISWRADDCAVEVRMEGEVRFAPDLRSVTSIERGGRFFLELRDGRDRRSLEVVPSADGLAYDWRVDGDRRPFDAAAQAWLGDMIVWLTRTTGLAAEERVTHLLGRGGVDAVLAEVGELGSDYVRARYLEELLERERLQPAQVSRVVGLTERMSSDHYRSEVLGEVAEGYALDAGLAEAFARAAAAMDSDHYRAEVLGIALESGQLTAASAARVIAVAEEMDSDHYRAEILDRAARSWTLGPELRQAYLRAVREMDSDHYREEALGALLRGGAVEDADVALILDIAADMDSDHYLTEVLERIPPARLSDRGIQTAFARAAAGMDSDHYKGQVLSRLVDADLGAEALAMVLVTARTIDSDHYLSELLVDIARAHTLSGPLRDAYMEAARSIGSDHYYGQVTRALERR